MISVDLLTNAQIELDQLSQLRSRLAESLVLHANQLAECGALPSEELLEDLRTYRQRMMDLSTILTSGDPPQSNPELELIDWKTLSGTIRRCHAQYQMVVDAKERAGKLLARIEALHYRDDPQFTPLAECKALARGLRNDIENSKQFPDDEGTPDRLDSECRPFQVVLRLVTSAEDLPDELWTELNDQVIESFGRPMATAVARGKIELTITADQDLINSESLGSHELPRQSANTDSVEVTITDSMSSLISHSDDSICPSATNAGNEDSVESSNIEPCVPEMPSGAHSATEAALTSRNHTHIDQSEVDTDQASIFGTSPPALSNEDADKRDEEPSSTAVPSQVEAPPATSATRSEPDSILDQDLEESIFDSISPSTSKKLLCKVSRSPSFRLISESPLQWSSGDRGRIASSTSGTPKSGSTSANLARNALQTDRDARHSQLSQLILQLLTEDRLELAYHLTRGIESRLRGFETVLPSSLIRALVLGRHLCYAQGEIARNVDEDLREFTPALLTTGDAEWNEATGLFVRAATLIPALLTSSATATSILRSFRITPGLSHLYNYCSRLSAYGHRLQGQASDLFTPDCDMTHWENETAELQRSIETWFTDSIKATCPTSRSSLLFLHAHWTLTNGSVSRYAESARLWSKWQECFRLVHRLLKPALNGHEHARTWVKSEIARLTQSVRLDSTVHDLGQPLPAGVMTFPLEAMVTFVREGVDFASRWLRLGASKPTQWRTLASHDAEDLRDEILERTDAVLEELATFGQQHPTTRTRAGIACLCGTIEHLRAIFSPHSTLALRETDPRHVLYGELLKIPNLKMNEQWVPAVDPLTLENEILTYLSGDPRDWKQAFELQCLARDHVATERILQLNVWRTELQREGLKRRRSGEIQICREELKREITDLQEWFSDPALHSLLRPSYSNELHKRIQRLETGLETTNDYAAIHDEINHVRLSVERQKREVFNTARRAGSASLTADSPARMEWKEPSESGLPSTTDNWVLNDVSDS